MTFFYWGIGILCAVFIGTLFIPATSSATRVAEFNASIEEVWAVYTDFPSQAAWRDDVASVSFVEDGSSWVEELKVGNIEIHLSVVESISPKRLVIKTFSPGSFEGLYTAEFSESNGKTIGTFTETSTSLGYFSKLIRFVFVDQDKIIQKYNEDARREILKRRNANSLVPPTE